LRQLGQRVAVVGHVVQQPARHQHEVVVDDVAARHLDRLDQRQRRLLAERPVDHHARVVALGPLPARPRPGTRAAARCAPPPAAPCRRAAAGRPPRSAPATAWRAVGVQVADRAAVLVVDRDRGVELGVGDRRCRAARPGRRGCAASRDVERAADLVLVVLRHVDVAHVLVREQQLPHARQVADDVADAREQHAVQAVEPPGQAELDGRARDAADVALVVGVALDHLELVAAAEDAHRQHAGGVDQLARHVHRHVADRLAARCRGLPVLDGAEVQVLEQRLAALHDARTSGVGLISGAPTRGERLARKAARPSLASRVASVAPGTALDLGQPLAQLAQRAARAWPAAHGQRRAH
jgi:hypothetical protein